MVLHQQSSAALVHLRKKEGHGHFQDIGYAGAFVLGTTIITVLGWIVSLFAGKIVAWVGSLFR
jgi:hypothetical protein